MSALCFWLYPTYFNILWAALRFSQLHYLHIPFDISALNLSDCLAKRSLFFLTYCIQCKSSRWNTYNILECFFVDRLKNQDTFPSSLLKKEKTWRMRTFTLTFDCAQVQWKAWNIAKCARRNFIEQMVKQNQLKESVYEVIGYISFFKLW